MALVLLVPTQMHQFVSLGEKQDEIEIAGMLAESGSKAHIKNTVPNEIGRKDREEAKCWSDIKKVQEALLLQRNSATRYVSLNIMVVF